VPLSALAPALAGVSGAMGVAGKPSSKVIDAHLAVQTTIRSYQVMQCQCPKVTKGSEG
jgi:hypothetical protein